MAAADDQLMAFRKSLLQSGMKPLSSDQDIANSFGKSFGSATPNGAPITENPNYGDMVGAGLARARVTPYGGETTGFDNQRNNLPTNQPTGQGGQNGSNVYSSFLPQAHPDTFMSDTQKYLQDLYQNRLAAGTTQLNNTRDTALQGLNLQRTQAQQTGYDNRNSADVQSIQAAQRLKESMANQGLVNSGDNVTANVGLQTDRQNSLNDINRQEGNQLQDLSQKGSLIGNQAASNQQALQQELDAQRAQALQQLTQYGDQRQFRNDQADIQNKMSLAQMLGYGPDGSQTMASKNADRQYGLNLAGVTGQFNNQPTMAMQNQNFNQGISQAGVTGMYGNNPTMQMMQMLNDASYKGGTLGLEQSKFAYDTDPNSMANKLRQAQASYYYGRGNYYGNGGANGFKGGKAETYYTELDKSPFVSKDTNPLTGQATGGTKVVDPMGLAQHVLSLGLDDNEMDKLFTHYKIDPNEIRQQLGIQQGSGSSFSGPPTPGFQTVSP